MKIGQLIVLLLLLCACQAQVNLATCRTFGEKGSKGEAVCVECKDNYHLYEGMCYVDILGCQLYVSGNICRKCANGYILVNNECCDKTCLNKVYLKLQNSLDQTDTQDARRKAELEGYEKSVSVLAKNSIKAGQNYEIISTKSQFFQEIYRYQVRVDIQGKQYTGLLDYNVETKQTQLVDLAPADRPPHPEITLNEENIHNNAIYEQGYKYIYMKYGLELYELSFARMTAIAYERSTELKFVFVGGDKAVVVAIVVAGEETYTLWKEEKQDAEEIKQHIDNLKQVELLSKEPAFQAVLTEAVTSKAFAKEDVDVVNITLINKEEYIFVIYIRTIRLRYVVRAAYNTKTQTVTIKKMEEVFHPKLQQMKEPERPQTKILDKQAVASSSEAKEVFDYLYKVRPSFRQTAVEAVKVETGSQVKTVTIMQIKEGKEYRTVILKDQKSGQMQLVEESAVVAQPPRTTIVQQNADGTTSITTNQLDLTATSTKTVISALKKTTIDLTSNTISTLQTVEGPKAVEYTVVLADASGTPTKQVTVVQSKESQQTVVTDVVTLEEKVHYIAPAITTPVVLPPAQFYRPEIKDLMTVIQQNSEQSISISKVKSITVTNTSLASKYEITVEDSKGQEVAITAIQDSHDQSVVVLDVSTLHQTVTQQVHTVTTKTVSSFGVSSEYSNDQQALSTDQTIKIALTAIASQLPQLQQYEVVSSLTKTYTQTQLQTLVLSDGESSVQVTGNFDIKTLRYVPLEHKPVPLATTYPLLEQATIPALLYPSYVREHRQVKDSESLLVEKYKMLKGKVPSSATVEHYSDVVKTTFTYEVGSKRFVAVVDYNSTAKAGKIIEMNPVQEGVTAVSVETRQEGATTITSSNSLTEIKAVNEHTEAVLATITANYPLLKKYDLSQLTLRESALSDIFEVTYHDTTTNVLSTITTIADKEAKTITVQNIETHSASTEEVAAATTTLQLVIAKEEYSSESVKQLLSVVESKSVAVGNISIITAEVSPSYTTYRIQVVSNGKDVQVTVIDRSGHMEVVAIHNAPLPAPTHTTTVTIDTHGNHVTLTNNLTAIKESTNIQTSIQSVLSQASYLTKYDVKYVQTTDYGTLQEIAVTFDSPETDSLPVQTISYYNQQQKTVKVISVEQVKTTTTATTTSTGETATSIPVPSPLPFIQTQFIPGTVVESVIKTDQTLNAVMTSIHSTSTALSSSKTVSVDVQIISEKAVKYTVVVEVEGEKQQAVYIANPLTVQVVPIAIAPLPPTKPYYYTTTQTEEGITVSSSSVQQVAVTYPQVKDVLSYAQSSLIISDQSTVNSVAVTTSSESTTYTLEVKEDSQTKTVVLSVDKSSQAIRLVDFNIAPHIITYPSKPPAVVIDVPSHQPLVDVVVSTIETSSIVGLESIKEVVSVKQIHYNPDRYLFKVINSATISYLIALEKAVTGEGFTIITATPETIPTTQEVGSISIQIDSNGNSITQTTQITEISSDSHAQVTIREVVKTEKILHEYSVASMKKIDYGTVEEIQMVFVSDKPHKLPVHSVAYYHKEDSTVKVVSLQQITTVIQKEITVIEGETTVTQEETSSGEVATPMPQPDIKFIPGFVVESVIESDKSLKAVMTTIHAVTTLSTATTVSAEVQTISDKAVKYTVVVDVKGEKQQAVYIVNPATIEVTPIAITKVPTVVKPVYIRHQTTEEGYKVVQTNNLTYIKEVHTDFKEVASFISTSTGTDITGDVVHVQVTSQDAVNTYKITTTTNTLTRTVQVKSDTTTNTNFLLNYQETIAAPVVSEPAFKEEVISSGDKANYLGWVKSIGSPLIANPINVVGVQTLRTHLATEAVLEVEVAESSNVYIKTIKTHDAEKPQVISITPSPLTTTTTDTTTTTATAITTSSSVVETIAASTTIQTNDVVGNIVTQSTHAHFITSSPIIQSAITTLTATQLQYSSYQVKYTKTVDLGKTTQVVLTLEGPSSTDLPIQIVAFYDHSATTTNIVSVQTITEESISAAPYPVPHIPVTTVPASILADTIKKDTGLKTVITQITKSSQWQGATVSTVEVHTLDEKTVQYNVVMELKGQKHQLVQVYDKPTSKITSIVVAQLSEEVKSVLHTQTTIDHQEVIISNRVESVRQQYPQTTTTIDAFLLDNPAITVNKIDSIVVAPSSEGSTISILAKNQQETSYVFTKYVTSESTEAMKVEVQTVPVISILRPKPVVALPISADEILTNKEITSQLIKIVNTDTTKTTLDVSRVTSITKTERASLDVYTIKTVDVNNSPISVEIIQNPITRTVKVEVDKVDVTQQTLTQTTVQEFTGKSEVLTTNVATIKESKEFKKITDYITKNHPDEAVLITAPVIENTEKYQRATIKTISFSQEETTIQGTYLIDQRSNTTIELTYSVTKTPLKAPTALPIAPPVLTITTTDAINRIISNNIAIINTLTVIQKVDFSLADLKPTFIEIRNYTNVATITLVFDTPTSNSRILVFYNSATQEAKVIDYTKVAKLIEPSITVETVSEIGQTTVFTTTKTITTTEQFTTVYNAALKSVPALTGQAVKGVSTTTHHNGKEYTILTVDSGIITQVVLRTDTTTNEVSFLSHSQTSVAAEVIAVLPHPAPTKLPNDQIQGTVVQEIATQLSKDTSLGLQGLTVVSGSVSKTEFTETYQLVVQTSSETHKTVKVVKDIKSNDIVVSNVVAVPKKPVVEIKTTTKQNSYGQIEVVTNNITEIVTTEEIDTVIRTIRIKKPQFVTAKPIAAKTVTYGTIVETTLVFSDATQTTLRPIQVTSVLNTKTKTVEIIDSRSISVTEPTVVAVQLPIQTIPAPAIKIAAKKNTEITQIITSVQKTTTKTTQIETLTVEDFGNVKKYVAIVPVADGKQEIVYFYDKTTNIIKQISSRSVTVVLNPLVYSQSVNQHGETVISSTSVQKITESVPLVTQAVELLTSTYSSSFTSTITAVQTTGTTLQQIQFTTVDASQTQSVVTVLADSTTNTVKIIDVRTPTHVKRPTESEGEGNAEQKGVRIVPVTPEERTTIRTVIESASQVDKTTFESFTVTSVTAEQSAFITTYTASIKDPKSGVTGNVTLVQRPGEQVQVVSVHTNATTVVVQQEETITQTTTSTVTGEVRVVTNDRKLIEKDHTVTPITKHIITTHPELAVYHAVATQTIAYTNLQQTTLVLQAEGEVSVQATVIYNTTSSTVQVIKVEKLQEETIQVTPYPIQTIPASAIKIAAKKNTEITKIITTVQTLTTATTQIDTLTVEDLGTIKKYVAMATVEGGRQQVVFLYDKSSQQLQQISSQTITTSTALQVEQTTTVWGQTTLTTNSLEYVMEKYPDTPAVNQAVDAYFQSAVSTFTEAVQVVQIKQETAFKLVVEVDSRKQEVTVIKEGNKFVVQEVQTLPQPQQSLPVNNVTLSNHLVQSDSEVAHNITSIIKSTTTLATAQVVSITASDSLLSTKYTVETRESTGKTTIVEFLQQPGEQVTLVSINLPLTSGQQVVQESITTKTVNAITSQTVTTTTDITILQTAEHQLYVAEVVKALPDLADAAPILIQTTSYGKFEEKTIILRDEKTTVQVTTVKNTETQEVKVIDHKPLIVDHSLPIVKPVTSIHIIPTPLISTTATQLTQISTITAQVKALTKKEVTFETITVEDLGNVRKYIAVQVVPTGKQQYVYLQDKSTQTITLLDSYSVSTKVEALVYEQTINQFGEKTITTSSTTEATTAIPDLTHAFTFITTKYPSATPHNIAYIHALEYPSFYESRITIQSDSTTKATIVVNVDKTTKEVTEVATYSPIDVHVTKPTITTSPNAILLPSTSPVVNNVVHFIESSKDVPVNEIKTVVSASSSVTVFGTEVITLQGIAADSSHVEVVVSYNPSTKEIKLNDYQLLQSAETKEEAVTEFRVDALTGTKTTITNDTTVIASSEITTALVKELQQTKSVLATAHIISTTTVEYPDKVKVVTIFETEDTTQTGETGETGETGQTGETGEGGEGGETGVATPTTQVTSIYDKLTASLRIIDTTTSTTTTTTQTRQVFTSSEVETATTIPSVPATTAFLIKEFPIYADQTAAAVIVESSSSSDLVSYIYQSGSSRTQVVVLHDKKSGQSTLIESNPIQQDIKPFFYEEKRNTHGQTVILSNNLTEVVTRIPHAQLLQDYIKTETSIHTTDIRTVQSTVGETFNTYTLVVDTSAGMQQYGYLVNSVTEEVKVIENRTLPGIQNILLPQPKPKIDISPQSESALPIINSVIATASSSLTSLHSVVSISKTELSNTNTYDIEFVNKNNQLTKIVVNAAPDAKPVVVDERPINPQFVTLPPVVIAETIDTVTKTSQVTYTSNQTFQVDAHAQQVLQYLEKNAPEVKGYSLESVRKTVLGQIEQYDLLFKSSDHAPIQISVANDINSKNILLLETRRITEPEQRSPLDTSSPLPQPVEVSDIEKENIKVLSKLGLVKDVKEYTEVSLGKISQNDLFVSATEAIKQSYSVLLKESVIIKVLEKRSLESDTLKVFFKSKDQIFEASLDINHITSETKLTDFIKIGTQATTKSEVNVYADLCYGYQVIEDIAADSNIEFLLTYLRSKYEQLREASLSEAQSIVLGSGRINYKLYFKKDGQTVKYIVYYEPQYKRVLEVKGTSFLIGGKYSSLPNEQQVADPYFRKLDTYIRQNRDILSSASVLHTESADDGRTITFRTVYSAAGKTYRSIAAINKDSQNVDEAALNEIVEIPTNDSPVDIGEDGEAQTIIKLDIHDLGKNLYFTEAHRFIQSKYQAELDKAQLLGASGKSNLFSYIFRQFYMVDDKMLTVSAEYNPLTQQATVLAEPQVVDVQEGFFPVKSDKRLSEVRNWLREKNLDLASAVMTSSMSKPILFGSAYKLQFKDMTKYYTYVVYYDATTREMRILFEKDSTKADSVEAPVVIAIKEPKLKGFARPTSTE